MIPESWRKGEVAVVGLARSGLAAARFLAANRVSVYASDTGDSSQLTDTAQELRELGVHVDLGGHDVERIRRSAAVVVSPGVPPGIDALVAARNAGVEVLAEIDLAARTLTSSRFVVVTGTNGKTTTTALIAHLLQSADVPAVAAGNIGRPLIDIAGEPVPPAWCVVEASSFQLHDAPNLVADVGVLTNLAPDHHNRYPSVDAYYADKRLLFQSASAASRWVLNADDAAALALADGVPGTRLRFSLQGRADAWYDRASAALMRGDDRLLPRADLPLLGDHNVANALAATLAAELAGVASASVAEGLRTFAAPRHRLERVGEGHGVGWINDSKATNVASAAAALRAMTGPYVWLAGGQDKGEDFTPLRREVGACRLLIAYGESGARLESALHGAVATRTVTDLAEAVAVAREVAEDGDVVLLSPACASFDQFAHFEDRGDTFRRLVADA